MQKAQAQNIVKKALQNDFDKERFLYFIKSLLNKVDESKAFHARGYIPEAYKKYIKTYERLATYTDPEDSKIDILVVYLQKETSLERARTAQRNFVARYLKDRDQKDAGLIAFVSPNPADWRFSLVKMEYKFNEGKSCKTKIKEEFTPAKRWSFLVGKNENSHTAQSRLAPIVEDDQTNITLKQLEEAFNIEKVTKEFFEKYRELYLRVHETLIDTLNHHEDIKQDFAEKNVNSVDFSKKLLGQIVFLYFLQKKGWFGVPMNKSWGEGDKRFLRTLFAEASSKSKNYFNDYLEPLFYEALAKERDDGFYSRFECKIPFLNGGLFDPISNYDWVNTAIELPNDIFSNSRKTKEGDIGDGVLDIFDRYNFTVKEDEPLEKEVAVDPEMLGKVFENLLEVKDRKSKGTYYTPREIVHYMCEQSLMNYLATELEGKISKDDIEQLIKFGENVAEHEAISVSKEDNPQYNGDYKRLLPNSVKEFAIEIDEKLAKIKVCDPAIGSGAFPVGMMNTIVKTRIALSESNYINDKGRTAYNFKRDCIQNSLYGVDIDPGAVEIAKLRLWLSLVVDEDDIRQIKPLPNLDYKIMQGNSLLETYEGIKLFDEKLIAVVDTGKEKQIEELKQRQSVLQKEYIELHSKNKLTRIKQAELDEELRKIQSQLKKLNQAENVADKDSGLFDAYSEAKKKANELKRLHKEFFEANQKSKKDNLKKQIEQIEWELIEATLKEQNKISALKKLEEFKRSNTKPFFLWKLNFADVFEEKGGFDVVIANPPYDVVKDKIYRELFQESIFGRANLYGLFIYQSVKNIVKMNGHLAFINPKTLLSDRYFVNLRKFLKNYGSFKSILKIADRRKVFDNVLQAVIVQIFQRHSSNDLILVYEIRKKSDIENFESRLAVEASRVWLGERFGDCLLVSDKREIYLIFEKIIHKTKSFQEAGIKFETGKVQWDLFKGQLIASPVPGSTRLIWAENIQKYRFIDAEKRTGKEFIKGNLDIVPNIIEKTIITQRTTADEQEQRIIATIFDPQDEGSKAFSENHTNYMAESSQKYILEFVLGLLNSRFFDVIFRYINSNTQVSSGELNSLPILDVSVSDQYPIVDLVKKVLDITKTTNYSEDIQKQLKARDIEYQIDELVYKLYDLTPDEIKVVESN